MKCPLWLDAYLRPRSTTPTWVEPSVTQRRPRLCKPIFNKKCLRAFAPEFTIPSSWFDLVQYNRLKDARDEEAIDGDFLVLDEVLMLKPPEDP